MTDSHEPGPTDSSDLNAEQLERISRLTPQQIADIDEILLSQTDHRWRKVAFVVGSAMSKQTNRVSGIPDVFYSQRVAHMVGLSLLESQGNLHYTRYSEVRRPNFNGAANES